MKERLRFKTPREGCEREINDRVHEKEEGHSLEEDRRLSGMVQGLEIDGCQ